jgi:hypothetical protein
MIRSIAAGALSLAAALLSATDTAQACSCAQPSTETAFERARAVFAGTVLRVDEPFWDWLGLSDSGAYDVVFQVTKRWKGPAAATATVRTRLTGEACGYPFRVDGEYLVYVAPGPTDDLGTGICTGTRDLAGSEPDMAVLDRLAAGAPSAP